ncbi:hypothetical protein JTB14_023196 [Gonioctena quinquepunctata]|nr:hypothetical protein JTB14_023196 [Gonioctena quinquepunctata]
MEVNRLRADELSYELWVRGASPETGTVDQLLTRLRQRIYLEKRGSYTPSFTYDLDADAEIATCITKLDKLQTSLKNFDHNNAKNERSRILSRLMHVSNRLSRIAAEGVQKREDEFIERCVEMCERLENIRGQRDIEEIPEAKIDQQSNISQHLLLEALSIHDGEQLEQEKLLLETPPRRVFFQASGLEHGERMPRRGEGVDGKYFYRNITECRNKGFDENRP